MTDERRTEIQARHEAAMNEINSLQEALDEMRESAKGQAIICHTAGVKIRELKAERDRLQARCEALEKALGKECWTCIYRDQPRNEDPCNSDRGSKNNGWQFDEARFTVKDGTT